MQQRTAEAAQAAHGRELEASHHILCARMGHHADAGAQPVVCALPLGVARSVRSCRRSSSGCWVGQACERVSNGIRGGVGCVTRDSTHFCES